MMMTPEQYAEIKAKSAPLLEKLAEVLNELRDLNGYQPVIASHGQIMAVGGTVDQDHNHQWSVVDER